MRGTAHYRGVVTQTVPASLAGPAQQYAVFGLFPLHDASDKEIRVLVRSPFKVPPRVDYEYVQVTGFLERPKPSTIPAQTEQMFARADYWFSDDVWVIEAWEITTFDPAAGIE